MVFEFDIDDGPPGSLVTATIQRGTGEFYDSGIDIELDELGSGRYMMWQPSGCAGDGLETPFDYRFRFYAGSDFLGSAVVTCQ